MSRKILFDKKTEKPAPTKTNHPLEQTRGFIKSVKEKVIEIQGVALSASKRSENIVKWIKGHPEFKWSAMCLKIGLDKGNFQRILKSDSPSIKEEHLPKIEEILKQYGYE